MVRALRALRRTCAALALVVLAAAPLRSETTVALAVEEARLLARQALEAGQPDLAQSIAGALLQRDQGDVAAWLLMSAAEARRGRGTAGVQAGRRAFALASTPEARFEAAYLTGIAHAQASQDLRAKLWLRRAAEAAPDAQLRAVAAQTFQQVSSESRLSLGFSLNIGPSDNVNGGSLHDTFYVIGIPLPIAEALPGGTYTGAATLRYRLAASARGVTELTGALQHRGVWLSDRAKTLEPGAKASDYVVTGLDLGLTRRWQPGDAPVMLTLGGGIGTQWLGGAHLTDRISGEFRLDHVLSARSRWQFALLGEQVWQPADPIRNATSLSAIASLQQQTGARGGRLHVSLGLRDTASDAATVAHEAVFGRVSWQPGLLPGGIAAELGLGLELRDYGKAPTPSPDRRVEADLALTFTELDYMGFAPRVNLRLSRNHSDFVLRDSRDFSLGFGLRSAF
ncbi:hypothetical protein GEU84_007060 [Fertoebacter nigrum]|uniref:DUF560 domain-containing protein n=1 Tax=Fertoeibacter niger TaxID=2656921 RepID=A0A8X8KMP6_9RHOB|nr:hypothetical protein [Fertoeibacter niger]NUB44135.1 hypothetical protein [Fertoeibacter niger]